jgi:hypothetical protein
MLMLVGESGTGPEGIREWAYLALLPCVFSAGYLLGWWRPLLGGCISLLAMAASLLVVGRAFDPGAYAIWGVLSLPGLLYLAAGLSLRSARSAVTGAAREQ